MTSSSTRTPLADIHPVELFVLIAYVSLDAILRLLREPPRLMRPAVPYSSTAIALAAETFAAAGREMDRITNSIVQPQASGAPSPGIAPGLTVAELRTMARQRGLTTAGGRQLHKARRADLLTALEL